MNWMPHVNLCPAISLLWPRLSQHFHGTFVTGRHFLCRHRYFKIIIITMIMYASRNVCVSEINVARNNGKRTQSTIWFWLLFSHSAERFYFLSLVDGTPFTRLAVYFMLSLMLPLSSTTYHVYYLFDSKLYVHCLLMYLNWNYIHK